MKKTNNSESYMTFAYEVKAPRKTKDAPPKATRTVGDDLRMKRGK